MVKITVFRGLKNSEFEELKSALKCLPFRVSLRKATQKSRAGAVHILPHKSDSPKRRWTSGQFEAVRNVVDALGISETGAQFLHSENADYIFGGGLWYMMKVQK